MWASFMLLTRTGISMRVSDNRNWVCISYPLAGDSQQTQMAEHAQKGTFLISNQGLQNSADTLGYQLLDGNLTAPILSAEKQHFYVYKVGINAKTSFEKDVDKTMKLIQQENAFVEP